MDILLLYRTKFWVPACPSLGTIGLFEWTYWATKREISFLKSETTIRSAHLKSFGKHNDFLPPKKDLPKEMQDLRI